VSQQVWEWTTLVAGAVVLLLLIGGRGARIFLASLLGIAALLAVAGGLLYGLVRFVKWAWTG